MADFRILNGKKKCTLMESFDGSAAVIQGKKVMLFKNLHEAKRKISQMGWEVNIAHIFGSSIKRELVRYREDASAITSGGKR